MVKFSKIAAIAGSAFVFAGMAFGQAATCAAPTSTTNLIRAEGTTEQVAALTFVCTSAAGQAAGGLGFNVQLFLSPALPVTSRNIVANTGYTEATVTVTNSTAGTSTSFLGTVSGSTINFSGTTPTDALAAAGTLTFVVSNVRVNATSLTVGSGVPPSIAETPFVSGPAVVPAALMSTNVAFAQNGLGALKIFKAFTGALLGGAPPAGAASGANNFVICNGFSPKGDAYAPPAAAGKSLAAVVEVNENFAQAFRSAADEVDQTPYATGATIGGQTTTSNTNVISTRVKLTFSNVPANVTLLLPVGAVPSQNGAGVATLTWVTSDTGTTAATTDSLASENGLALRALSVSGGSASVTFSATADDLTNLDKFDIPVFIATTANSVPGSTTAMTVSASFAPVGSTSVPNFAVGASTVSANLSTFNLCTTSLLFSFVTNQLGFDTGLAIANTSTDPFGANGATPQAGTCTLNFYGDGAPSPANVPTPNIPSGTVYTQVLSGVAAGFQGYMIAQCNFQYAHGFAFITDGVGANGGLSQGYLAGVIPDVNQIPGRPANPGTNAPAGTGETLGN
jgi:hypothetical protein